MHLIKAALLLASFATPLMSQDFDATHEHDWTLITSEDGKACFATISVGLKSVSSGLLTLSLYPRKQGGTVPAVMTAQVPLGASLPSGIAYTHRNSSEAAGMAWQYCTDRTCVASGGVSETELKRLKAGTQIYVGFVPLPGSASLVVPVSLLGITKVWDQVQACG